MTEQFTNDELLIDLYYDLKTGFGSAQELYRQAKKERITITLDEVRKFLAKQPNKQRKAYKGSGNSYVADYPRDQFQMDIGDMVELQIKDNQKRFLLAVIDIFSKYGMAFILNDKSSDETYKAIQLAFKTMGIPRSVYTDDGSEFKGKVKELFEGEGITHITTVTHAHVVERYIRTIKNGIHERVRFNNAKWEDMLPYVINKYNDTPHSSTGYKPNEGIKDKNASAIKVKLEMNAIRKRRYPTISVDDYVKIFKKPGKYGESKESKSRWTDERYKVVKVDRDMMMNIVYKLEGKQKSYLRHELLLVSDSIV